jgi:prepilin-type processing-associated H-X9-DG protein
MVENERTENGQKGTWSRLAIISFVLGLGWFLMCLPVRIAVKLNPLILVELLAGGLFLLLPTIGIVLAVVALRQIRRSGGLLRGRALAISGLVLAIVAVPLPLWGIAHQVGVYCKSQVISIDGVTKEMTVELTDGDYREFIEVINIMITGELEGSATVDVYGKSAILESYIEELSVNDRPWVIEGKVRLEVWGEWYDDVCVFKYEPVDVRSGSLKVRYYLYASPYAQRDDCATKMRGLASIIYFYVSDNEGKYPAADRWCDELCETRRAYKKDLVCPKDKEGPCSYAINPNCGPNSPDDVVLLFETKSGWNQCGGAELLSAERHGGQGCNVLFNDWHVEYVEKRDFGKLNWGCE